MTPVWDRYPADWGWPQSSKQHKFEFEESRLPLPKVENTGRAQPALQCCTLHSLERDHTHLWSNIES